jgi:subtilase family serine protease
LSPGATDSAATLLTIPAGTAPGNYYILAKADADAAVAESQEGNNLKYMFIKISTSVAFLRFAPAAFTAPVAEAR